MISKLNSCTEVRGLQTNLTLVEIKEKEAKLQSEVCAYRNVPSPLIISLLWTSSNYQTKFVQVQEMEEKLNKLRTGVILVKPEDKKIIEDSFAEKVNQWKKRKRMFKELWDNITENSPKDQKEFKVFAAFPIYPSNFLTALGICPFCCHLKIHNTDEHMCRKSLVLSTTKMLT